MNSLDAYDLAYFDSVGGAIDFVVENEAGNGRNATTQDVIVGVQEITTELADDQQEFAHQYIVGLQQFNHGTVITTLDPGIGGLYDGSKRQVSTSSIMIGDGSIKNAIDRGKGVDKHEMIHEKGGHTGVYKIFDDEEGSNEFLVLGGVAFENKEELIEGRTEDEVKNENVSTEYKNFRAKFRRAVDASLLSEVTIINAIDKTHNLVEIDDRKTSAIAPGHEQEQVLAA